MTLKKAASERASELWRNNHNGRYCTYNEWVDGIKWEAYSLSYITKSTLFDVDATAAATDAAAVVIIITQSYCESISISCNGRYWFGIFVNGTKLPWGVIAAIKRKQSNEYHTKSHTIFMHHEIQRFDDSKSVTIFTQEKSVFSRRSLVLLLHGK